jgi:hypothetical protein
MARMAHTDNPQAGDVYDRDLHPNNHAGEIAGNQPTLTAYDIKDLHNTLRDFPDNELRQIPVLPPGTRLEEGATYLDLRNPQQGEFTGMNNMTAGSGNWYVPKSQTDFELWNRLCNNINPSYRLGRLSTVQDREASDPDAF